MRYVFWLIAMSCSLCIKAEQTQSETLSQKSVTQLPIKIVFTHENRSFADLLLPFTKQSGIELDIHWIDQADLKSRLIRINQLSDAPDVIICPSDNIGLSSYANFSKIPLPWLDSNFNPEALSTVTLDKHIYGIPLVNGNHLLMYYNKSLIRSPASDWSELLAQANKLPNNVELIGWSFMEMYWFVPFITAFGDAPMVNNWPNLDTESVQHALQFVWQLRNTNVVDSVCPYDCVEEKFSNGKLAYTINGVWAYKKFSSVLGNDLGIAALPQIKGQPMRAYYSSIAATFPNNSLQGEKREALKLLSNYLQSKEFQRQLWYNLRDIPARPDVYEEVRSKANNNEALLFDTLKNTLPMSSHKNMSIVWEALLKGFTRFGSGKWDAQKTTQYMQSTAEKAIRPLTHQKDQ